jgi:3-oxoacyl-[acyl-carrier-protein] synthase II
MITPGSSVAVTGLGLMTGLGADLSTSWAGLVRGECPIRPFTLFDPEGLTSPFGVEIPQEVEEIFKTKIKTRNRRQMTRATMMSIVTTEMALEDAGIQCNEYDKSRIGAVIGCTGTGYAWNGPESDPNRILKNMASASAAWISLKWKIEGPCFTVSTACASGVYALSSAINLIQSGECDIVICGATDSILNYDDIDGFCALLALSDDCENMASASRPFDKKRNGFVMGEGCGILILESMGHALKRQARIYAAVHQPGLSSEAYNILSPQPAGTGMIKAIQKALAFAGLTPKEIDYINAHGTSTLLNDQFEAEAISAVFSDHCANLPVSSTKSMTGHCLSAAAGVEAVIACKSIVENIIPPTMNIDEPEFDLDFVPDKARKKELKHVMSNSFAFGGHNGVAIFSKVEEG